MSNVFVSQDKDVRLKLNEALNKYAIKQIDVARETEIHHSTLSLWLQGKLKGNNIKIEDKIETWLTNLYSNKPKLLGSVSSRFELLKGKRERPKLTEPFDDNHGFGNLIPININIELEGKKFKEIFFWEKNEPYLTLEGFAKILVEDNQLPFCFESEIINQMNKQINLYRKFEKIEGEILRVIKLDIRIGDIVVTDQFEWDINNPKNNPDDFAINLCADLGLGSEFILPIAHSIKTQILEQQKLFLNEKKTYYQMLYNSSKFKSTGYYTGEQLKTKIDMNSYLRNIYIDTTDWQPQVKKISLQEIKKYEKKEERNVRHFQRKR